MQQASFDNRNVIQSLVMFYEFAHDHRGYIFQFIIEYIRFKNVQEYCRVTCVAEALINFVEQKVKSSCNYAELNANTSEHLIMAQRKINSVRSVRILCRFRSIVNC